MKSFTSFFKIHKMLFCRSFLVAFILGLTACGVKETRGLLSAGEYDAAIHTAVENLQNNKVRKGKQPYIAMLEEAFFKAKTRDLEAIDMLIKDANPSNLEKVFNLYVQLNNRQEIIKPLLPLRLTDQNRAVQFEFENYTDEIVNSKNALSKYLYNNTKVLLTTNLKSNFRRAFDDLNYLEQLSPNYKDVRQLMVEARLKGTDFVSITTKNETNMIIPVRLENDLLDISTYGLNQKWTVFHTNRIKGTVYDFGIILNFRAINISPEQIKEKEFVKEKQVKVGQKKLLDARGNVVKDSIGKAIMVDDLRTVSISIYESRQLKQVQVTAKVDCIDFKTNQLTETFPLTSEFTFENIFATYKGDKRACEDNYFSYFDKRLQPFPSNEQMVFDTGEDLKVQLKKIIGSINFSH